MSSPSVASASAHRRGLRLRALLRERGGLLVVPLTWAALATGHISTRSLLRGEWIAMAALAAFVAVTARVIRRELAPPARGLEDIPHRQSLEQLSELELGLVLITGAYALIHLTGGAHSFLYPLLYALVSFLAILHRSRGVAITWLAAVVLLELVTGGARAPAHLTFIGFFAAGNSLVLASLVRRLRSDHDRTVRAELERMRREARDFRLVASRQPLAQRSCSREEEEARMAQGAVEGIHEQLRFSLGLLREALELHACVLLWVHPSGESNTRARALSLKFGACERPDQLHRAGATLASPGVLAALLHDAKPLRLQLQPSRPPPYYKQLEPRADNAYARELCAVPVTDDGQLIGILCADRLDGGARFDDACEAQLLTAARHVSRVVRQERALASIERDKYEQEQFYRASELLGEALTLEDVYEKTFAAIAAIASFDLAVITDYDAHVQQHTVLAVHTRSVTAGDDESWRGLAQRLEGLEFDDGIALVAMAIKNRHTMPADAGKFDPDAVVFSPRTRLTRARSLLVLPLLRGDQVLGAITLAASQPRCFHEATREMLRVISHQVAVSLQNARMYSSMEQRATTDGLTGLTNHRAFQERLSTLHDLAERTGQKYSLILTDIDHFKRVNDTYGHPVGDAVLQRVAQVFAGRSRKVDIVARYGGEEFVIVLPDTDGRGAEVFANELREEVAAQIMRGDSGQQFNVTLSMGIAEYPRDGDTRRLLIERADQALYRCKEGGRNRVIRWSSSKHA